MRLARTLTASAAIVVAFGTATALWPRSTLADDEEAAIGDVTIKDVAATPARAGETTKVTFSVENAGTDRILVTGVRLPTGGPSRVVGFMGTSHSGTIGVFSVEPGEAGYLDGKDAWVEVGPLKQDMVAGTVVPGRLQLGRFEAPFSVHVIPHEPAATGSAPPATTDNRLFSSTWKWLRSAVC